MKPMMTLTLADVKRAARDYYLRGRLIAQHPAPHSQFEMSEMSGANYRCAIGAALTDEVIAYAYHNNLQTIACLWEHNVVQTQSAMDRQLMADLMTTHDAWAGAVARRRSAENRRRVGKWLTRQEIAELVVQEGACKQEFLNLLCHDRWVAPCVSLLPNHAAPALMAWEVIEDAAEEAPRERELEPA